MGMLDDSAFPVPKDFAKIGMSLRDWFASVALHGVLRYPNNADDAAIVERAYQIADAMMAKRAAEGSKAAAQPIDRAANDEWLKPQRG